MWRTHPWTVMRAHELIKWVESDDYQKIIDRKFYDTLNCFKCGAILDNEGEFCGKCGEKIWNR